MAPRKKNVISTSFGEDFGWSAMRKMESTITTFRERHKLAKQRVEEEYDVQWMEDQIELFIIDGPSQRDI